MHDINNKFIPYYAEKRSVVDSIMNWITLPLRVGNIELSFSPLQALLRFILPLVGILFAYKLILFFSKKLIYKPEKLKEETKGIIYHYTRLFFRLVLLLVLAILIGNFFETEIQKYLLGIWNVLKQPFFSSGGTSISIVTLILAVPVFYIASWMARATKNFVDSSLLNRITIDESTKFSISTLVRYTVLAIVVIVGLSLIGINLSSLAVIFGVLGIGVGFGLQDTVANFFAGLVIIFERPLKEGDRVLVAGLEGDVVQIRLRSTIINTLTNETIVVPNSKLVGNNIHNYSYKDRRIIIVNKVQVSYGADLELVEKLLLEIAEKSDYVLKRPEPGVRIAEFQDSGILVELWSWIPDSVKKLDALSAINMEIWRSFKENGVVIPFPQLDVHMDK